MPLVSRDRGGVVHAALRLDHHADHGAVVRRRVVAREIRASGRTPPPERVPCGGKRAADNGGGRLRVGLDQRNDHAFGAGIERLADRDRAASAVRTSTGTRLETRPTACSRLLRSHSPCCASITIASGAALAAISITAVEPVLIQNTPSGRLRAKRARKPSAPKLKTSRTPNATQAAGRILYCRGAAGQGFAARSGRDGYRAKGHEWTGFSSWSAPARRAARPRPSPGPTGRRAAGPALPGLATLDLYAPVAGGAHDPFNNDGPGPLFIAMLAFPSREALGAAVASPAFALEPRRPPGRARLHRLRASSGISIRSAARRSPRRSRAPFSYVVRYHKPAEDEAAFIRNYVDTHPPTLGKLPGIRSVMCYFPLPIVAQGVAAGRLHDRQRGRVRQRRGVQRRDAIAGAAGAAPRISASFRRSPGSTRISR